MRRGRRAERGGARRGAHGSARLAGLDLHALHVQHEAARGREASLPVRGPRHPRRHHGGPVGGALVHCTLREGGLVKRMESRLKSALLSSVCLCLSVYLSVCLSLSLSPSLSVCLSVSLCLSLSLSLCLSPSLSLSLSRFTSTHLTSRTAVWLKDDYNDRVRETVGGR